MSTWNDAESWAALVRGDGCPICRRGEPLDAIATLPTSWVTMGEAAPLRGYCCLVHRTHVVELHDLDDTAATAFMRDARLLSRAVHAATGAVKMNYEVHGNTIPHLHMHFYPRFAGDRFEGGPIDPRSARDTPYGPGEYEMLRRRICDALSEASTGRDGGKDS